jgi:hypothetical protein
MGADCGCGGTCPVCSCVAGFMIPAHRAEITEAARRMDVTEPKSGDNEGKKEKTD